MRYIFLIFIFFGFYSVNGQSYFNFRYQFDTVNSLPKTVFLSFQEKNDTLSILGARWENINNLYYSKSFLLTLNNINGSTSKIEYLEADVEYSSLVRLPNNEYACTGVDMLDSLVLYRISIDTTLTYFYKFSTPNVFFEGRNLTYTNDNHFLILGKQYDYNLNTSKEYLLKIDNNGDEKWKRSYPILGTGWSVIPTSIFQTVHNNYIALRTIYRYPLSSLHREEVTSIEKIDTSGNRIWEYKTPVNRLIAVNDGLPTEDNGVVFCGTEGTKVWAGVFYQGYICKIDSLRQVEWEYSLGTTEGSFFYDITKMNDGSYLASGIDVLTYPDGALVNNSDSIHEAGWLVKFAPDGTKLWERHFMKVYDIPMAHIINETQELSNGDLLSVGYMFTGLSSYAGYWGWLIRTDSFGCIVPGCQLLDNTENVAVVFDNEVVVYPNPASEVVRFRFDKAVQKETEIRVYSGLGQLVGQTTEFSGQAALPLPQTEAQINVSDWHSGMYFYGVYVEGVLVKQGQVLVQR